ncbi:zinc finger protein, putative [Ichthyophthirius multifiliis]|uniref:Zinc finger protein, putative n=1 Tax=Ichthyophthirius multifiliis TaxID=5932 RepID=G0QX63_ICHMU|nr:zinc finger protein, putative [Ichthyophthirius multifiliis]EGR30194.1 zinc finger protein, putative [Ichthyophthirius multifiliis]|eukprot:XP_004031790.1 zinc finger protein, putative [Ichthyophthirius multifiliis]
MHECVLCYDEIKIVGIGQCNHKEICYKCQFKMRYITDNQSCPLCNKNNQIIIVSDNMQNDFSSYDLDYLIPFDEKKGLYAKTQEIYDMLLKLIEIRCFAPGCKEEDTVFQNISTLKKHLKDRHQRFLCDICVEFKTCVLQEQKLYNSTALEKHTRKGDFDEEGNVYFFHPYCSFCLKYFYDEESLVKHMPDHFTCFICGPDYKYIFYKSYQALEKHFRISHYICEEKSCQEKCFTAFKTSVDLEAHNIKVHNHQSSKKVALNQMNIQVLTGFEYGQQGESKFKTRDGMIKDKEGVNFEAQFLSLRKTKMKTTTVDSHEDEKIDYRDFYCQKYDERYQKEEQEILQQYYNDNYGNNNNKGNNRNRNNQQFVRKKSSQNEVLYLENIPLLRYYQIHGINNDNILDKLGLICDQEKYEQLEDAQHQMQKKKCSAQQYFEVFERLCGKNIALRVLPLVIASLNNTKYEVLQKELDEVYISEVKKLAKKHNTLINSSNTYKEFFTLFRSELENQLTERIVNQELKLNAKALKMERSRRFQLIEILRRIKTKEMAKLKFVTNFGVSVEKISFILRKVFFSDLNQIQKLFKEIPNHEFLHLYLYVSYCHDLLQGKDIHKEKNQLSVNILKDYFEQHQDIYNKYYSQDDQILEQEQEEEQKVNTAIIQQKGNQKKTVEIDTQNIYDFPAINNNNPIKIQKTVIQQQPDPSLPTQQPMNTKEKNKKINTLNDWQKSNENPFIYESKDQKVRVNQILKEEFPTLGGGQKVEPYTVPTKKQQQIFNQQEIEQMQKQKQQQPIFKQQVQQQQVDMWEGPTNNNQTDKNDIKNLGFIGNKKKNKQGKTQISVAGFFQ